MVFVFRPLQLSSSQPSPSKLSASPSLPHLHSLLCWLNLRKSSLHTGNSVSVNAKVLTTLPVLLIYFFNVLIRIYWLGDRIHAPKLCSGSPTALSTFPSYIIGSVEGPKDLILLESRGTGRGLQGHTKHPQRPCGARIRPDCIYYLSIVPLPGP